MMAASWINSITGPLKAAGEMAQGLVEIRDTVKFGDAIIKLQAQIMTAQQGALAAQEHEASMAEEIRSLKGRVDDLEAWDIEKQRYHLTKLPPGAFVYALEDEESGTEPLHYLCTNCFENQKKSILQSEGPDSGVEKFRCNTCGAEVQAGTWEPPPRLVISDGDY